MSTRRQIQTAAINAAVLRDQKTAQAFKIREIKAALASSGHHTLYHQALALGLCRSTTWNILSGGHKHVGLTADVVNTILGCQTLPDTVKLIVNDYARRKLAGEYGHSEKAIARFEERLAQELSSAERATA
ncbi:hypothetical protein [Rhodoplanes sp. Z2-YC6860]|uniref:hypothetical protein n=1 Tax=Rhodoplanes sp. Z2-YC6860 TaxID=674703 RepID=UPI0008309A90|nr:hypothetical protein [Rhodoplanes sp. Z2-YC6860]